jgi:hypothetical protein
MAINSLTQILKIEDISTSANIINSKNYSSYYGYGASIEPPKTVCVNINQTGTTNTDTTHVSTRAALFLTDFIKNEFNVSCRYLIIDNIDYAFKYTSSSSNPTIIGFAVLDSKNTTIGGVVDLVYSARISINSTTYTKINISDGVLDLVSNTWVKQPVITQK